MKWVAVLSVLIMFGCSGPTPPSPGASIVSDSKAEEAAPTVPVIIEAKITGGGGGSKYYWYDINPTKVIKNTIDAKLSSHVKVAIQNDMPQIEVGKTYVLNLVYYNESHPEYGLKIESFNEK